MLSVTGDAPLGPAHLHTNTSKTHTASPLLRPHHAGERQLSEARIEEPW
jgi:hypothetical protein